MRACNTSLKFSLRLIAGFVLLLVSAQGVFAQERELQKMQSLSDSLFRNMSIDELKMIQQEYNSKVDKLRTDEEKIRGRGLEVTESFLEKEGDAITNQDKILVRVAEYYIEAEDIDFEERYQKYEVADEKYIEELDRFLKGEIETEPTQPPYPKRDYSRAIGVYDQILNKYLGSEYADEALYSKAFLLEKMGEGDISRRLYQEIIDRYPDSQYAAEAYMLLAEYYFNPREGKNSDQTIEELFKAIRLYKNVLRYRDSKRYDEALYKLGWSYYRLSATDPKYYSDAIVYFLAVVDDISRAEKMDPRGKMSNFNVRQEAIQYIGISFSDEDTYANAGVQNARRFIEKIGGRQYGVDIMRALGETYQRVENNERAIEAYTNLLDMYPYYEEAPLIQKKVADTYYAMGMDQREYNTRYDLFQRYNPRSDWYNTLTSSEIPDKIRFEKEAYRLTERALYTNIILDIQKAQEIEKNGQSAAANYEKVAQGCEEYLEVFASDSNAYEINWNYALVLDIHLNRFADAFEQYIRVSNDYLETGHQEDAANNAIFVADTLVRKLYGVTDDTSGLVEISGQAALTAEIMGEEENRLVEAYNNYIKLFPDGEKTPVFLAKAGAMYFNHKQFAEAKVYFNTLVKRFPGAKEKSIALRSIMDSYFALGKFRDSEFIAKRILGDVDVPDEEKIFAEKRLAQAIFKNAKLFEDQGQFYESANEYYRVYVEAPTDRRYVDAALFNSGLMFDRIKEWEKALEVYQLLADKYPDTKYDLRALRNAAEDYKELKEFSEAGRVYERIYTKYSAEMETAEPALANASYYYKEGEDWTNAIRVNNTYIGVYPNAPLAMELYFDNAGHYLKLDNLVKANEIYESFASRYPDDPRAVESFYRRGSYYLDHEQKNSAKQEFNRAIAKSEELGKRGLDPNRYYAGESLNSLAGMLRKEFASIQLMQPKSNIESNQARMQGLLKEILSNNTKIIANGSIRSFEAVYNNAEVYEQFATTYATQERTPGLNVAEAFRENKTINEASAKLYDAAVDQYKQALKNIPLIADKFNIDMFAADTVAAAPAEEDTALVVKRAEATDTTKLVARKWFGKASEKISFLLYKEAQLTNENIKAALSTDNPQKEPLPRLIYQLRLLNVVVAPAVQQTIDAHRRNVMEASGLGLDNKYVQESKRQILLTSMLLAEEIERLAYMAIADYPEQSQGILDLIKLEYGAVNDKGQDYPMIHETISQMVDYSKELAVATLQNYGNTLKLAKEDSIENDLVRTAADRMMRFSIEFTDKYIAYHDSAQARVERCQQTFETTENYNYEDAMFHFQDQALDFSDYERMVLDEAFMMKENYQIDNLWANKLLARLFQIDPARYAASVPKERIPLNSDDSWIYSEEYSRGYVDAAFNDSAWTPVAVNISNPNQFAAIGYNPTSMWRVVIIPDAPLNATPETTNPNATQALMDTLPVDSLNTDSLALAMTDSVFSDSTQNQLKESTLTADTDLSTVPDTVEVYFRKQVNLEGAPVGGLIYITADDDYRLFLNGEYIIDDNENNFAIIDTVNNATLSYYLKPGLNTFAIHAVDFNNTGGGVKIAGYIETMPVNMSQNVDEAALIKKSNIDPAIRHQINVLNKNRLPISKQD
jgi:TolA-binding protein